MRVFCVCGVQSSVLIKVHYGLLTAWVWWVLRCALSGFSEQNNLRKIIIAFISKGIVVCMTSCASHDATDIDTDSGTLEHKTDGGPNYFYIKCIDWCDAISSLSSLSRCSHYLIAHLVDILTFESCEQNPFSILNDFLFTFVHFQKKITFLFPFHSLFSYY